MPRKQRREKLRREPLDPAIGEYLLTGETAQLRAWDRMALAVRRAHVDALWQGHRDELLPAYIAAHPGTRPFVWWLLDQEAPRWQEAPGAEFAEPRQQLGGIGTPGVRSAELQAAVRVRTPA